MNNSRSRAEADKAAGQGDRPLDCMSGEEAGHRYTLATLRVVLGKTQMQVAKGARMAQGDVSVLENRQDVKVSTLGRYARALGGHVETAIVIGNQRYVLDLPR